MKEGDVCVICGGIEGGSPTGGEVDESGVCVTCQPCPTCDEVTHEPGSQCFQRWFD